MTVTRSRRHHSLALVRGRPGSHPLAQRPAVITTMRDHRGESLQIEQDGVFYRREHDQDLARRQRQADALRAQIRTRAGTQGLRLANELVDLAWSEAIDEQLALLRQVGWILVSNGRQDLWRLAYLEFSRDSTYIVGDERRFLLGQPTAEPTPLRDQDDVA